LGKDLSCGFFPVESLLWILEDFPMWFFSESVVNLVKSYLSHVPMKWI